MNQKEANAQVPSMTIFSDRSVILNLLTFLGQVSSSQAFQDEGLDLEQVGPLPPSHSK
jgi:hypothetical protein